MPDEREREGRGVGGSMRVKKIQNSCYGNQEKRANKENRNSRVVLRIKDYEFVIATVCMTEIMIRAFPPTGSTSHLPTQRPTSSCQVVQIVLEFVITDIYYLYSGLLHLFQKHCEQCYASASPST